jgi:glycosyltransferase involved in cell wall biosynthesis
VGPLERVLIVNTSDVGGGAEGVAMAMLDGFPGLGTDAWLAVGRKESDHPRVMSVFTSPNVDYRPIGKRTRRTVVSVRRSIGGRIGLEDFNHPHTRLIPDMADAPPDVVFCNNLHGGYFDLRELPRISRRVPTVLRLADSWTFTGHCAVPPGCERWRTGCGSCPDLATPPAVARDATRRNWKRKRAIFRRSRLHIVAPSRWLLERAEQSLLAPAIAGADIIPNGVDLDVFRSEGPSDARVPGVSRLLFVANGGSANPYKDFATIRRALGELRDPVELLAVGGGEEREEREGGSVIRHLARRDPASLAALYRSADLYVHAASAESFSLTAAEALACGTPVAAASAGGIGEVVDRGRTGLLVPPGDSGELAAAITRLLDDTSLRERMARQAATEARDRFDQRRMVSDLHRACERAAGAG